MMANEHIFRDTIQKSSFDGNNRPVRIDEIKKYVSRKLIKNGFDGGFKFSFIRAKQGQENVHFSFGIIY